MLGVEGLVGSQGGWSIVESWVSVLEGKLSRVENKVKSRGQVLRVEGKGRVGSRADEVRSRADDVGC